MGRPFNSSTSLAKRRFALGLGAACNGWVPAVGPLRGGNGSCERIFALNGTTVAPRATLLHLRARTLHRGKDAYSITLSPLAKSVLPSVRGSVVLSRL